MKTTLKTQWTIRLLLIILIACGSLATSRAQEKKSKGVTPITNELFVRKIFSPIGHDEYQSINLTGKFAFSVDTGNPGEYQFLNRIEPVIDISTFENYFKSTASGIFEGIRIYPGYLNSNLVLIMCQANLTDNREANYLILSDNSYDAHKPLSSALVSLDSAGKVYDEYKNKVLIFFRPQKDLKIGEMNKVSRFYKSNELTELIKDNPPVGSQGLNIGIEFGYVPSELGFTLKDRLLPDTYSLEQLQGFTCNMFIVDSSGNRRINPTLRYGGQDEYTNRYLEVGHPCPPRCGTLRQ